MAQDVTHIVKGLSSRVLFLGITFEMFVLILYATLLPIAVLFWYRDLRRRRFSTEVPRGCRRLGITGPSNAADEFDQKYAKGTRDQSKWRVKAMYIHPIKSCSAIEMDVVEVDAEGILFDRKFAFAELREEKDEKGTLNKYWKIRTLREGDFNKLALVKPEIWVPSSNEEATNLRRVEREGRLIIRYPNIPTGFLAPLDRLMLKWGLIPTQSSFSLPLIPRTNHKYPVENMRIWNDDPAWFNMGEHIPSDFKEWLGAPNLAIFRADPDNLRPLFRNAPKQAELGFQPAVAAVDSYPLHLLNTASIHDVSDKVGDTIQNLSVRRFRPNILIEGPPAFDEDDWKRCKIGEHEIYSSCHTTRCRLPNVCPDTAFRHPVEPYKALHSYRCIDPGSSKNACLGMQLVPKSSDRFQIRVGDGIEVLERGEHFFLKT